MPTIKKDKFFIFSDESGSWHDPSDVYVRSWVIVDEEEYNKLINKIDEIAHLLNANELTWKTIAGHPAYFDYFINLDFRVFITISSPSDIAWETKYILTRNFNANMQNFDFGELDQELQVYIKDRVLKDIKNALFLNFYERYHIENAKRGIERVILPTEYELIYRVDPPQMPHEGWKNILNRIHGSVVNVEFPRSNKSQGIQFADIIAGCFRSMLLQDRSCEKASGFLKKIKDKLIQKDRKNPNPNLIFWNEVNDRLKARCASVWDL